MSLSDLVERGSDQRSRRKNISIEFLLRLSQRVQLFILLGLGLETCRYSSWRSSLGQRGRREASPEEPNPPEDDRVKISVSLEGPVPSDEHVFLDDKRLG